MPTSTITVSSPPLVQSAFADHGQEIELSTKDSSFSPVSSGEGGNQVKVVVNYAVHDPMVTNDLVKGVMKVYSPDGTLLKTSSSPTPFPISNSYGTTTLATTLTDPTIESATARIVFTNPIKTETISNELPVNVDLIRGSVSSERQQEPTPLISTQSESEEVSIKPLSEDKLSSMESAISPTTTELEQQPIIPPPPGLEEAPIIEEKQQVTSIESVPQTITDPSIPPPMTTTTTTSSYNAEEICDDGIDNDSDTLVDFSDEKCNPLQAQKPLLQQQQITVVNPEICDDDLDNDLDDKVDGRDEDCSNIATTSSFPSPRQAESVTNEQTGGEDEDKQQQSDDENNDDDDDKEDD